ncbi:ubiquinone/menaquinone biosynthesis C-methylase UbiE [Methanomicrobium sp. W14]|uniref:class I SAM-dependent methyltransferase n=1 Tax=Methanomicrobium sp. W14 TaxID=2817839 RepID=UPI001AE44C35|nr:class I SAM-dependent methyltransferase [Methanomicrobium sp. W14]MBP2134022.1 ubiquinone/menaquinone biosynthesis C-methylase UbiE [Methanomicrobium sp. W14]
MMIDISDIDWNFAWNNPGPGHSGNITKCTDRWTDIKRCRRFNESAKEDNYRKSQARINAMDVTRDSVILDVGAGPGTLAVPLSKIARRVTAVEPTPGMLECLRENIRESGIDNIDIVEKRWEDIDPKTDLMPEYDIVVASYSLGFPDLMEALLKMNEVSRKYVYIFWFADMQSPWRKNYAEIWEPLFGVPARKNNPPNIVFNLLNQAGIYANIEVSKEEQITKFRSLDDAVGDQGAGLKLKDDTQYEILRNYLRKKLCREDGGYALKTVSYQSKIWWDKEIQV